MKADVYQIFFDSLSKSRLDPAFIPYDNSGSDRPQEREIHVFKKGYRTFRPTSTDTHIGFLSWKFSDKSGVSGHEFQKFLVNSRDADVVLVNPFPEAAIYYKNTWDQGDEHHQHLRYLAEQIFSRAGLPVGILSDVFDSNRICFCNSFTGKSVFWDGYLQFIDRLEKAIESLSESDRKRFEKRADRAISANHYSFFFERCLSTYLHINPQLNCVSYSRETILERHAAPNLSAQLEASQARRVLDEIPDLAERSARFENFSRQHAMRRLHPLRKVYFNAKYRVTNFMKHGLF